MNRGIERQMEAGRVASDQIRKLEVVNYLTLEQQSAIEGLARDLILFKMTSNDPKPSGVGFHLFNTILAVRRVLDVYVPREVILAVLDKNIPKPEPVTGVHHGGGG